MTWPVFVSVGALIVSLTVLLIVLRWSRSAKQADRRATRSEFLSVSTDENGRLRTTKQVSVSPASFNN
jgi:hypothetical protein